MYETRLVQHRITSGYINIVAANQTLPAFWAHPEVGGPFPGLVLIHEWWGLTQHIRTQVRRFAELGFYVIAPDLFEGKTASNANDAQALKKDLDVLGVPKVNAAIRALETHHRVNGRMGVVGWHMGGELAYHVAMMRTDLDAVVVFYGDPKEYMMLMPADETPILSFYGEHDRTASPELIEKVRTALADHGQVIVYTGATTGFFNEDLPTYNAEAAADAWGRTLDFLCENMDISTPLQGDVDSEVY